MYYAEQQTLRSMPEPARAAQSAALKQALDAQAQMIRAQIKGLEKVFQTFLEATGRSDLRGASRLAEGI
jgi:ferritin-like metal-binding protein YciE